MIQYGCPFCGEDTCGTYPEFVDITEQGARYYCLCAICCQVSLVQTFPFEVEPSPFLKKGGHHEVCMN